MQGGCGWTRRGHLVLSDEVQVQSSDADAGGPLGCVISQQVMPPIGVVDAAVEIIVESKRPMIIVGSSARNDMAEIIALAEQIGASVATTFKGKGAILDQHELGVVCSEAVGRRSPAGS